MAESLMAKAASEATNNPSEEESAASVTPDPSSGEATEQTSEETGGEATTEETTKTVETPEGAPETYEFTKPEAMPEDAEMDSRVTDAYSDAARKLNLPQDKAQELFETTMTALHEVATSEQEKLVNQWSEDLKKDPEVGGDKLDENLAVALKAVETFGSDGLSDLLTGPIGNHPDLVRFLVKVGATLKEDDFVGGNPATGQTGPSTTQQLAAALYPNHK